MPSDRPLEASERPSTIEGRWRCQVCLHSLNVQGLRNGAEKLVHGPLPSGIAEHEPVPEPIEDETDIIASCDFCSCEIPPGQEWTVPAESFSYNMGPGVPVQNSIGGWACCPPCADDFANDRLEAMAQRWISQGVQQTGVVPQDRSHRRQMKREAIGYWRSVKKYALGPPEPARSIVVQDAQHRHEFRLP